MPNKAQLTHSPTRSCILSKFLMQFYHLQDSLLQQLRDSEKRKYAVMDQNGNSTTLNWILNNHFFPLLQLWVYKLLCTIINAVLIHVLVRWIAPSGNAYTRIYLFSCTQGHNINLKGS